MWPINFIRASHVDAAIGIILRVPGLIIIDYWWQHERNKSLPHSINSREIINALLTNLVLLHGFLLLLLPLRSVQVLYKHFISFALLLSAHLLSYFYIHLEPNHLPRTSFNEISGVNRQFTLLALQVIMAGTANFLLRGPGKPHFVFLHAFSLPVLAHFVNYPRSTLETIHNVSSTIVVACILRYVYYQFPNVADCLKEAYQEALTAVNEVNGWTTVLVGLWNKLFVPNHFLVFWLGHFVVKFINVLLKDPTLSYKNHSQSWSVGEEWYMMVITIVSNICSSPVSLIATAVMVSHLSRLILKGTKCFLMGEWSSPHTHLDEANSVYSGWTEGLTLIIFSVQTGLLEMKMPSKIAVMTIILFIDLSTLLQSMLEIVEPVLLALATTRSRHAAMKRLRVFFLCVFLFAFPLYLTHLFIQLFKVDFWMLILLSSCLLTSFQVIDILVVHFLFLYDWESSDELIYYSRAAVKILEFAIALFVLAWPMGLFDSPQAQWNWANSTIILIHCYVNIWQRLVAGWRSFNLRRQAAQRIMSLPLADAEKLRENNDLCSICFSEMTGDQSNCCILTPCDHFFHRTCLRKWLYVRNACPLCHTAIS